MPSEISAKGINPKWRKGSSAYILPGSPTAIYFGRLVLKTTIFVVRFIIIQKELYTFCFSDGWLPGLFLYSVYNIFLLCSTEEKHPSSSPKVLGLLGPGGFKHLLFSSLLGEKVQVHEHMTYRISRWAEIPRFSSGINFIF